MTCNNCLQEIVEGELFLEDEDEGTAYHVDCRQAAIDRRNKAEDERAALKTRAEAAEAEAQALRGLAVAIQGRLDFELERRQAAEARVAELEAALAAQGWRPVTITEPSQNTAVELLVIGYRGHDGYWHYPGGAEGLLIGGWRPEPPDPQEPTP